MKKEFSATHRWKQYPKIEFEINWDKMKVRVKGKNDLSPTKWVPLKYDQNDIMYFSIKGEKIYQFDFEKILDEE